LPDELRLERVQERRCRAGQPRSALGGTDGLRLDSPIRREYRQTC
jgi:hypothetical protein